MSNDEKLSFQELKSRVSVIEVASFLGYQHDRSKGLSQPSFVLTNGGGEVIDRIYIKNPNNPSYQGYWRRNGLNNTGDVISFVKEHIDKFGISGRNEIDTVNKVLHKFAGKDFDTPSYKEYRAYSHRENLFDPSRWINSPQPHIRDKILSDRGFSTYTTLTFSNSIHSIQDKNQDKKYTYVAFPYTIPGSNQIVGYELRGLGGFKSKASGTNSSEGMWIAKFTDNPLDVKNIFIAESGFDALAFYQIHKENIDLKSAAFVSFGGSFSDKQFQGLMQHFSAARPILLFDKDLTGNMYDIRTLALMNNLPIQAKISDDKVHFKLPNKEFSIPTQEVSIQRFATESGLTIDPKKLIVPKPQGDLKDWNDVLKVKSETSSKYEHKR